MSSIKSNSAPLAVAGDTDEKARLTELLLAVNSSCRGSQAMLMSLMLRVSLSSTAGMAGSALTVYSLTIVDI